MRFSILFLSILFIFSGCYTSMEIKADKNSADFYTLHSSHIYLHSLNQFYLDKNTHYLYRYHTYPIILYVDDKMFHQRHEPPIQRRYTTPHNTRNNGINRSTNTNQQEIINIRSSNRSDSSTRPTRSRD